MGQSNTLSACTGLFDSPMLPVVMGQSHAYAYGTRSHMSHTRMELSHTRMGQSHMSI